nr:Ig-like domain-containing protein [uncultured Lacibacter sp.]
MTNLKSNLAIAVFAAASLLWSSCKKETSEQSIETLSTESNAKRLGGLTEDDPVFVSQIPLIMSSGQVVAGRFSADNIAAKGKPGGGGGSTGADATPPSVTITSPGNGSSVSGVVTVLTSASDNVGVASVSFSVNGSVKATLTAAPYTFYWDAGTVANGTHTLTATAKDAKGNTGTYTITVSKNTVVVPPPTGTPPSSYFLQTPPIGTQGYEWTCVPFATTYAARSIEQFYRTGASSFDVTTNIFSPEYVYNQTKIAADCGSGTAITLTLDLMKNKGVLPWSAMPYSDVNGCLTLPTAAQDITAASYKIGGYAKIINTDRNAIKSMIAAKHPVMASILVDNNFQNAGAGFVWKTAGTGNIGHALIICGYDDARNAYKVMNSWGTSWGDAGYSWIDYDFFPSRAGYYVYVMNY